MSGSVVALLMGLVLLGLAVWLLWRANSSSSSDAGSDQAWGAAAESWGGAGPKGSAGVRAGGAGAGIDGASAGGAGAGIDGASAGDAGAGAGERAADDVWGVKDGQEAPELTATDAGPVGQGVAENDAEGAAQDDEAAAPVEAEHTGSEHIAAEQIKAGQNAGLPSVEETEEGVSADEPAEAAAAEATAQAPAAPQNQAAEQATSEDQPSDQPNARMGKGFASVRKRRRTWAQSHGFEYLREDRWLVASWPWFMVGGDEEGAIPTATDVVSGFAEGHKTHIADVNGRTLMAMRRDGFSLVDVHYTEGEAMPEGMRRSEPLDQPPYVAYTTDVRALDRMLDLRVEDALASLSQVASDIAWSGDWVVLRISRKLDTSVWDEILPHVRVLVDASMVLPPEHVNIPLEMDHADQTRALPGGAMSVNAGANLAGVGSGGGAGGSGAGAGAGSGSGAGAWAGDARSGGSGAGASAGGAGAISAGAGFGAGEGAASTGASEKSSGAGAVRGHLRAMPDADAEARAAENSGAQGDGSEAAADAAAAEASVYSNTVGPDDTAYLDEDRPEITRPAEPVVFPSRSENPVGSDADRISGDGAHEAHHEDFRGADIFDDDDDDDTDHINGRLPRLGEDPAHTSQSTAGYSQVIRSDADHEATIFFDYEDDAEDDDEQDFTDSNHVLRAASEPVVDSVVEADFADVEGPEVSGAGGGTDGGRGAGQVVDADFADVEAGQGAGAGQDGELGVPAGAASDDATGDSELTNVSKMRRDRRRARRAAGGGGRHRAPDARHARPEPIEAVEVEIETVDAEIVEDDD